jgi:hypothetical protein
MWAVTTLRQIANKTAGNTLNKQAVRTLTNNGFIKAVRTTWQLTDNGKLALKYHDERDAWKQQQEEKKLAQRRTERGKSVPT